MNPLGFAPLPWMDDAFCTRFPPDTMFPESSSGVRVAKSICADCPVKAECLREALRIGASTQGRWSGLHGIWGGTTPEERKTLRKKGAVA